jgi:hypothetical protein
LITEDFVQLSVIGLVLIVFGVLYLRRPTVYRRGVWLKTSIAIRLLSEEGYKRYIKGLGVVFIVSGASLVAWENGLARLVQ